jgi:hypothetical protein
MFAVSFIAVCGVGALGLLNFALPEMPRNPTRLERARHALWNFL